MRKSLLTLLIFVGGLAVVFLPPRLTLAEDCDTSKVSQMDLDQINELLAKCERARQMSIDATKPLEGSLGKLELDFKNVQNRVAQIEADMKAKEKKIKEAEGNLVDQEELLGKRVRQFYIRSHYNSPLLILLAQNTASDLTREMAYRRSVTDEDKRIITRIVLQIKDLENKKAKLAGEKIQLAKAQEAIDKQAAFFRKEIAGAKAYQAQLTTDIGGVTQRQQQLLAEKYGGFTTSVGDVDCETDNPSNPFSPAFAAFSFGAPHRVGMSQYGALGRARAGQSAEDILKAYFSGVEIKKDYPVPETLAVDGYGRIPFEGLYLKGIAEMPSSWGDKGGMEALKAQAVAARSYALAATNNGQSSICPTESCQVYIGSNKGGKWEEAVNATRGWVMVADGQPIKAWYASTAGGFTRSSADVWGKATSYTQGNIDTACGGSSCWPNDTYEGPKYGNSCWFHKA
ncbi:MAG: SpoIID/LytB domain-containing protein, partial [bacterium]|nr:SpoIID/LytB domain-containing protein [bacterium]